SAERRTIARDIESREVAIVPDVSMPFVVGTPVSSHDLALGIDKECHGADGPGAVDGRYHAVVPENAMEASGIDVDSRELADGVDAIDRGDDCPRYVHRSEAALVQYEAVRVAIGVIVFADDFVRAVPIGCRSRRAGDVDLGKVVLSLRCSRNTQE